MEGQSITYDCERTDPPHVRMIHYNDVYHIEYAPYRTSRIILTALRAGSREPVGGVARFQSLCNYYRSDPSFKGQPELLTFFSGDAFNPSLESSVTKGTGFVQTPLSPTSLTPPRLAHGPISQRDWHDLRVCGGK